MIYRPLKAREVLLFAEVSDAPQLAVVTADNADDNVVSVKVRGRSRRVPRQMLFESAGDFREARLRGKLNRAKTQVRRAKLRVLEAAGRLEAADTLIRRIQAERTILEEELASAASEVVDAEQYLAEIVKTLELPCPTFNLS